MFCTQCGQQNPDDSRFCARCGAAVAPAGGGGAPAGGSDSGVETTSTISLSALEGALAGDAGTDGAAGEASPDGPEGSDRAADATTGSAVEALPAGSALLVVKRGPNAGSRFLLDADTTTAGRHPESDIFLDDVTVSRRHAEFARQAEGFLVRDVGSLNGTYLNRERIEAAALTGGDEVQIGKYRLLFLEGGRS